MVRLLIADDVPFGPGYNSLMAEDFSWKPIEPLSSAEAGLAIDMAPLYETWRSAKQRLQETSGEKLAEFNRRLVRRVSAGGCG